MPPSFVFLSADHFRPRCARYRISPRLLLLLLQSPVHPWPLASNGKRQNIRRISLPFVANPQCPWHATQDLCTLTANLVSSVPHHNLITPANSPTSGDEACRRRPPSRCRSTASTPVPES